MFAIPLQDYTTTQPTLPWGTINTYIKYLHIHSAYKYKPYTTYKQVVCMYSSTTY